MSKEQEILLALGKRIDQLRIEKGLSFQTLANMSDFEKSNLVKLVNQGNNVTVSTLIKIAESLEVNLKDLFDDEQEPDENTPNS